MDLKELRISQAPRSAKTLILALLLLEVVTGIVCGVYVIHASADDKSALLQAAAYALGVGMPLFVLALLIATASTGIHAIERRTGDLFFRLIPEKLKQINLDEHDPAAHAITYKGRGSRVARKTKVDTSTTIRIGTISDASTAYYEITTCFRDQSLRLWISVDLALKQATVCLRVPLTRLGGRDIADRCRSTLEGARVSGGYTSDRIERHDAIGGETLKTLILRTKFDSDEFLWDSTKTYFFVTDLCLMVTSFMRECAGLLHVDEVASDQGEP